MKKILIILLAILCIPISGFAMSLSTLQNNPERYLKVFEDYKSAVYTDTYSVKSIRYAPPYYTLSANIYYVVYGSNIVFAFSEIYNYDHNYSTESTMSRIMSDMYSNDETLDEDTVYTRTFATLRKNSGIERTATFMGIWKLNGQPIKRSAPTFSNNRSITYHTVGYDIAESIFKTYYKQSF